MSDFLRAAREKIRGAIGDIDARLQELEGYKTEEAQLRDHRGQLVALLGEDVANVPPSPGILAGRVWTAGVRSPVVAPLHDEIALTDARIAQLFEKVKGLKNVDAATRVLALLKHRNALVPAAEVHAVSKLPLHASKRLLQDLMAAKFVVQLGWARGSKYRVPSAPDSAPAEPEGDRRGRPGVR